MTTPTVCVTPLKTSPTHSVPKSSSPGKCERQSLVKIRNFADIGMPHNVPVLQAFLVFLAVQRLGFVLSCSVGIRPIKPHLHCGVQEENHQTGGQRSRQVTLIHFRHLHGIMPWNRLCFIGLGIHQMWLILICTCPYKMVLSCHSLSWCQWWAVHYL